VPVIIEDAVLHTLVGSLIGVRTRWARMLWWDLSCTIARLAGHCWLFRDRIHGLIAVGVGLPQRRRKTLLLIPSVAKRGIEREVADNLHPTMDYYALQARLDADLADYTSAESDKHVLVRAARGAGRDAALAMHGFLRASDYDVIFSNGENVGIPLAALFALVRRRPVHVLIGHRLTPKKKAPFLRALHSKMDHIFVYSSTQRAYGEQALGIPRDKLHLIPFHADTRFYQPVPDAQVARRLCSAGLELRDYPTLIEAVRGVDVEVCLAAASPWSKRKNETTDRSLPANVTARAYPYRELRDLYASSQFVVVPLYENDFQAGVTTMLEGMAMGKAVIVSKAAGQTDVIEHNVNGLYVPPGDPPALRQAILHLLDHPEDAARLGRAARQTVESTMSLDRWVDRVASLIEEAG
jgi:glycosyltransferase involved in cell wall biosynthesis